MVSLSMPLSDTTRISNVARVCQRQLGFLVISRRLFLRWMFGYRTLWAQDTSAPRHFGPAWDTFAPSQDTSAPKNVVRDTSASDLRKVGTLCTKDNTDKTQLHRRFGLKLVPKCLAAEMSCGRSVRLVSSISEVNVYLFSPFGSYSRSDAIC